MSTQSNKMKSTKDRNVKKVIEDLKREATGKFFIADLDNILNELEYSIKSIENAWVSLGTALTDYLTDGLEEGEPITLLSILTGQSVEELRAERIAKRGE